MRRQAAEVTLKMRFNLVFSLHDKAQTEAVAESAGDQAQPESSAVPDRIEQGFALAEFLKTLLGPGQMIGFLGTGAQKMGAKAGIAGGKGLGRVKRLSAHLAHMVDAHQGARVSLLGVCQYGVLR